VQTVAIDRPADWFATAVRFTGLGTTFLLQGQRPVTLPRLGTHNVYNALFTIAAASELGVSEHAVLSVLAQVPAAARRLEPKVAAGVTVFDDTYNMNPLSASAGLQALAGLPGPGRRIAVFGEMLELGERSEELHRQLGRECAQCRLDLLVCVGTGARPIAEGAAAAGMPAAGVHQVADRGAGLAALRASLREGDRVLCKASRRVQLDRLVDELLAVLRGQAGTEAG
jgi:UDP-N-acetylmuramoyl-tripeptide--D-alanyl-D-alanine ligase